MRNRWWRINLWRGAENLPELSPLAKAERRKVWKETYQRTMKHKHVLWTWPVALLVFAAIVSLGFWFHGSRFNPGLPHMVVGMMSGAIGGATVAAIMWTMHSRVIQRSLWRQLPHLCSACGYDLTGNTSGVCPECGRTIDEKRGASEQEQ